MEKNGGAKNRPLFLLFQMGHIALRSGLSTLRYSENMVKHIFI